ncbi:MAG: site-2 protease family protein [Terriglobales bacterium]|jgi:membrane-associated protease RseP (regulator of RpoE activity)
MSDPTSPFPSAREWEPQAQPGVWVIPPPRQRWWLHLLLLVATFLSTLVVGARIYSNFAAHLPAFSFNDDSISLFPVEWMWEAPAKLMHGLSFSLTLMFILLAHEMGHYLYARHYRVYATPPFFIPFPSLIGTLGAFIRIKGPIPNRTALFDIGIAGPIAGFIPSCVALLVGISLSHPIAGSAASDVRLGFPLAFHLAARLLHTAVPLSALSLHPIAAAAWVGMFATALNLLPGGQLDGGHIVFSLSSRLHRWISLLTVLALVPLGKYLWTGWFLWAVLLAMTARHPRVPRYPDVTGRRRALALCAALILALSFTPAPFTHSSGREVWPQIRDGSRDTLHDLRNGVRHLLHRK